MKQKIVAANTWNNYETGTFFEDGLQNGILKGKFKNEKSLGLLKNNPVFHGTCVHQQHCLYGPFRKFGVQTQCALS